MFLCCRSKQSVEQTLDWPVIQDAKTIIWRRHNERQHYIISARYVTNSRYLCEWYRKHLLIRVIVVSVHLKWHNACAKLIVLSLRVVHIARIENITEKNKTKKKKKNPWMCPQATTVNSLWPSDTIWRQISGSTLAQVMDCCLTTTSHYLNQCWLIYHLSPVIFILGQFRKRFLNQQSLKSVWKLQI